VKDFPYSTGTSPKGSGFSSAGREQRACPFEAKVKFRRREKGARFLGVVAGGRIH